MQLVAPRANAGFAWFHAWVEAEQGRFVLVLPVAMAGGVVWYFGLVSEPPLWLGALVAMAGMLPLPWLGRLLAPRAACHLVVAGALGFAAGQAATWRAPPVIEVPSHATVVTGIIRAVDVLPAGRRVLLSGPQFDDGPAQPRSVRIRLRATDMAEIGTGDVVKIRALLQRPMPPAFPGAWDLQRDAFFAGIGAYGTALNPTVVVSHAAPGGFAAWTQMLREAIGGRVRAGLPGTEGAIATTLLTGSTTGIPAEDRGAFRDSGLAHLLAIAGLHIGIVMGLVFGTTRFVLLRSEAAALHLPCKAIAAGAALLAGGLYLGLTGAHVPIIRSFAMACLVTLGVLAGRRALSLRGLGLAMAAVVLIAAPEVVGVSFQMSFSAVLALIVGYAALRPWLVRLRGEGGSGRGLVSHVVALALTSALAGTFSAPYAAYHFGHVQIYYVFANMAAVPITAMLVMPAGLLSLALMPLHLEFLALAPMGWGIAAILWIARQVAALPQATISVAAIPDWGMIVFSLGLAWAGIWRTRLRLLGVPVMLLGLASPLWTTLPDILVSADARLIALRNGGQMLVQRHSGASNFTLDAWKQLWAIEQPMGLDCPTPNCLLHTAPDIVLVRGDTDDTLCGKALLISAEPIRLRCPAGLQSVDRFTVWREGAQAIFVDGSGLRVRSDQAARGERPWVLGLPLAGRVPPGTVPALVEPIPD